MSAHKMVESKLRNSRLAHSYKTLCDGRMWRLDRHVYITRHSPASQPRNLIIFLERQNITGECGVNVVGDKFILTRYQVKSQDDIKKS